MISKRTPLCLIPLLLLGCSIANTPGFHSGYKKLDASAKSNIVFVTDEMAVCDLTNDQKIYAVTAAQLLKCLEKNDSSVVYFWSPNCHGESCISLKLAQSYCDTRHYKLYVITEYYDPGKTSPQNVATLPLLSVNHLFYRSDYCNKYTRLFSEELAGNKSLSKDEKYNRFYIFSKGRLIGTQPELFKK